MQYFKLTNNRLNFYLQQILGMNPASLVEFKYAIF